MTLSVVILVIDSNRDSSAVLVDDLGDLLAGLATVEVVATSGAACARATQIDAAGGIVPVAFVDIGPGDNPSTTVLELHDHAILNRTRNVLVTSRASLLGADDALRRGAIHGMITRPWTTEGLDAQLRANLAVFLLEHSPDRLDDFDTYLDNDAMDQARTRLAQHRTATQTELASTPLLLDNSIHTADLEARMLELLDRALGHPPRIRVAPGTILIEAGDDIGGIYLVLDGVVRLSSRTPTGEQILHEQSTGAIIGLLSLASHRRAMLQCRAVTDVRAVPITLEQLARALDAEPELASLLTRVLISSLARRLRRSDELQMELDQSLAALSEARAQLVATARFAALGEMAAGMAHELNNPTAALIRATEHLASDISEVLADADSASIIERHRTEAPMATGEARAVRRKLTDALGDRQLAEQMMAIGIIDPGEALEAAADKAALVRLEASARLGRSLQNLTAAAERVQTLVASLRAYARGDDGEGPLVSGVDVEAGIDDALRLLSHRMSSVELRREIQPTPTVTARPGALQQVWTNVLANALDAIGENGRIDVVVAPVGHHGVRVRIIDNGPGIPNSLIEQIFEPRFTTKNGRVEFGLGLGLSISRQIVKDHQGTIDVVSRPGHTEFVIDLPAETHHE